MNKMTWAEAVTLINEAPDATYYGRINGYLIGLVGRQMKGYILPTDIIEDFRRF